MGKAQEFNDENFDTEVLKSDKPVVVDFSATWCQPCKQLAPIIEELASEYEGKVKVGKLDVDESQVAERLEIRSVPTVLFFKGGTKVDALIGLNPKRIYQAKIDELVR